MQTQTSEDMKRENITKNFKGCISKELEIVCMIKSRMCYKGVAEYNLSIYLLLLVASEFVTALLV